EETYARIVAAFEDSYRVQSAQFAAADSLGDDRRLLEHLLGVDRSGTGPLHPPVLPGAGYFFTDDEPDTRALAPTGGGPGIRSPRIATLARRIRETYGPEFLDERADQMQDALSRLRPEPSNAPAAPQAATMPVPIAGFAERYRELLSGWLAVVVLREGR